MDKDVLGIIGGFIGLMVTALLSIPLNAWVVSTCWNWFISPFLHMPSMGLRTAIGIDFVIMAFTLRSSVMSELKDDGLSKAQDVSGVRKLYSKAISTLIARPLGVIGTAWIWHALAG